MKVLDVIGGFFRAWSIEADKHNDILAHAVEGRN